MRPAPVTADEVYLLRYQHKRVYLAEGRTREESALCRSCYDPSPCATTRLLQTQEVLRAALQQVLSCPTCDGRGLVRTGPLSIECACRRDARQALAGQGWPGPHILEEEPLAGD